MTAKPLSNEEFRALAEIARARRDNTRTLFQGTKLVFGKSAVKKDAVTALKSGKKIRSLVRKLQAGNEVVGPQMPQFRRLAQEFVQTASGIDDIGDIVAAITSEAFQDLISEITPLIGVVRSTKKAAQSWNAVITDTRHLYRHDDYKLGALPGDPLAAADAIKIVIERNLARDSVDAARHTAVAGTKIAGLFADMGTATTAGIGLGNAIAGLTLQLASLGLDIKDMHAGNRMLQAEGGLGLITFKDCPLLGCYLLTCSDTSNVANFFVADIGLPGWMDRVETLKKHKLDKLIGIAGKAIRKSRLHLDGLQQDKGTYAGSSWRKNIAKNKVSNFKSMVKARLQGTH